MGTAQCHLVHLWPSSNERFYVLKWLLDHPRLQARFPPFQTQEKGQWRRGWSWAISFFKILPIYLTWPILESVIFSFPFRENKKFLCSLGERNSQRNKCFLSRVSVSARVFSLPPTRRSLRPERGETGEVCLWRKSGLMAVDWINRLMSFWSNSGAREICQFNKVTSKIANIVIVEVFALVDKLCVELTSFNNFGAQCWRIFLRGNLPVCLYSVFFWYFSSQNIQKGFLRTIFFI